MRDFVYGRDVVILAWKGDDYYPFACAEQVAIEMRSELIESTTGDSGAWEYWEYTGRNSWSARLKGTTVLQDSIDTLWFSWELFLLSVRSQKLDLKIMFTDKEGNEKYATGEGLIPVSSISGDADELSDYDLEIKGSGALDMNGLLITPTGTTVKRILWITTGSEPNKVQNNALIGIDKSQIMLVTNEDQVKFEVIDSGTPTDRQCLLDNTLGELEFAIDFPAGAHIICLYND